MAGMPDTKSPHNPEKHKRKAPGHFSALLITSARHWYLWILLIVFFWSGLATLSQYGMTWDEGLGNFFFGERYLMYLTHFEKEYLDFNKTPAKLLRTPLSLIDSPFRYSWHEFPPVADTLSAATMHVLSYRLGWMDPVDGFHFFTILLTTLFLGVLYFFSAPRIGRPAAFAAIVMLGTYPRLWTDMHFNVKDVPETALYGSAIIAYYAWYEQPRFSKALVTGLLSGLALGIKGNAVFIPITLILGVWPVFNPALWKDFFRKLIRQIPHYLLMAAAALSVYVLSWPILQRHPKKIFKYFEYLFSQGGRIGDPGWKWRPSQLVLSSMPEIMLLLWLAGLVLILVYGLAGSGWFQKEEQQIPVGKTRTPPIFLRLLFVWSLLPIIRISLPGMINFDGIRHFIEFVPAAALIAGWCGVEIIMRFAGKRRYWVRTGIGLLLAAVLFNGTTAILQCYPYSHVYFNKFVGGQKGAEVFFGSEETSDYWASSYRQGLRWLNANTPPETILYVPIAGWVVRLTRNIWLRPDISVLTEEGDERSVFQDTGRPVYMMFVHRPLRYTPLVRKCLQEETAAFQIRANGIDILSIYRIHP